MKLSWKPGSERAFGARLVALCLAGICAIAWFDKLKSDFWIVFMLCLGIAVGGFAFGSARE